MKENELNTITGVIADPESNIVHTELLKDRLEIERIINIFNMNKEQKVYHKMFAIKNLATFRLVLSNN